MATPTTTALIVLGLRYTTSTIYDLAEMHRVSVAEVRRIALGEGISLDGRAA